MIQNYSNNSKGNDMKNLKLACASLLTLSLISCDLDESPSKESDKGNETITTDNPQLPPPITGTPNDNEEEPKEEPAIKHKTISIYEDEPFNKDLFIFNLRENDEVLIEIKGEYSKPNFSSVYIKKSKSSWLKRTCIDIPLGSRRHCFKVPVKGKCESKFRDPKKTTKFPVIFKQEFIDTSIKYSVSDQSSFFQPSKSDNDKIFRAKIKVTKEMLDFSNDLRIQVNPTQVEKKVRVGFLGFKKCEGVKKDNFKSNVNQKSRIVINKKTFQYLATVKIRYIE